MTTEIKGGGGEVSFRSFAWPEILDLAIEHGWEPAGTRPPNRSVRERRTDE